MLVAALSLAFASQDSAKLFDACVAAHRKLTSATIQLRAVANVGERRVTDYTIRYMRPEKLVIRVREHPSSSQPESDRTYALQGDTLTAYDAVSHERLSRKAPAKGSLADRMAVFTNLDEPVRALLDPDSLQTFLSPFRELKGWRVIPLAGKVALTHSARSGDQWSRSTFEFKRSGGQLARIELAQNSGTLEWTMSYLAAPRTLTYLPPQDALSVTAFRVREPYPKGMDAATRAVADSSVRAYDRLRHGSWIVEEEGARSTVWLSGTKMREKRPDVGWAFDGATLYVDLTREGTFHQGRKSAGQVLDTLLKLRVEPTSTLWNFMSRKNPMLALLASDATVKVAGSAVVDGAPCKILDVSHLGAKTSVFVRDKDGLWARYSREMRDDTGRVLARIERAIRYSSVGSPLPDSVFKLSPTGGARVRPLP